MKKGPLFFAIFLNILILKNVYAESKETILPPIIITPSRIPQATTLQSVSFIQNCEFDKVIGSSINDIVKEMPSIDFRQRGFDGVQADLSIRGATFEESSVLINGVRMNDPQTGHHNMDIPLTSMDLESIEALRGGGSALYGPDAFGGALNFITKRPADREVNTAFSFGTHDFTREAVSVTQPIKGLKNRVSFERQDSSGYRGKPTAFHTATFSFDSLLDGEWGEVEMIGGGAYKDFGASTFYSSLHPNEHESTDTRFGIMRGKFSGGAVTVEPKIYCRRHWDRFILDNDRPLSRNIHKTYTLGSDIQATVSTDLGTVIAGTELAYDKIDSTNLNKHKRNRQAVFMGYNHTLPFGMALNADARLDYFSTFGLEASPSVSVGYDLNDRVRLRSSANRSYRIPSFTDLYYNAPGSNMGNASLKPESAWSYETGVDYDDKLVKIATAVFSRNGSNIIDWVRNSPQDSWRAVNAGRLGTFGAENLVEIRPKKVFKDFFIEKIAAGYDFINSEKHGAGEKFSKYALNYLRHNVSLSAYAVFPFGIEEAFKVYYKRRVDQRGYFLLESKTCKKIKMAGFDTELYFEGANLLNTSYSEITDVPAPGIRLTGGFSARF